MNDAKIAAKAKRLTDQAMRLYGMTRRQAQEWAFAEIVRDFEQAAANATRIATFYSPTLGAFVTIPTE